MPDEIRTEREPVWDAPDLPEKTVAAWVPASVAPPVAGPYLAWIDAEAFLAKNKHWATPLNQCMGLVYQPAHGWMHSLFRDFVTHWAPLPEGPR